MATAKIFKWTGTASDGTKKSGEITAGSKDEVTSALKRMRINPTSISESGSSGGSSLFKRKPKITEKDIVIFTRQFATMFNSGIPIVQGLDILSKQSENKAMAEVVGMIKADVETGMTLAEAMKKHPKYFDDLYV
ncbi:MAG: type II secretion system F family protein, partial [Thermodesulfovibrionales bacterium]|nr:type II secretion system F family protein [Thermodesulfovibrionales bacterium]